jgi:hypothetical protein
LIELWRRNKPIEIDRDNEEEEREPQEKEDAYKYPYRLFILQSVNATGDV